MKTMILLQAANAGGGGSMWIWMILLVVLMWLLMIRPQQKKAKEEQKFREGLKKGDRVVFSGGIYGKVNNIEEHTIDVEVSNGVILTVEKSMIQPAPESKEEKK
ncbi:MAG: preprotein translocase subunit YajC [Bacteroidales bacterium]|nr:preprotein translocase subunit YajC [Bacteroidales bacterium]